MTLTLLALLLTADPAATSGRYEDGQSVVVMSVAPGAKQLQIDVTIKVGFHLNDDYPINFQPDFGGPKVEKKQMALTPCPKDAKTFCVVKITVPLAAAEAAKAKTVGGLMAFAACDADVCLIKKVPLSVRVGP